VLLSCGNAFGCHVDGWPALSLGADWGGRTGDSGGEEVVLLFLRPPRRVPDWPLPLRTLAGFRRVSLAPGSRATVAFDLAAADFEHYSDEGARLRALSRVYLLHLALGPRASV
jgi:Fibronectin type III-like domain